MDYSYILALHLIAVIAWMVGLLYLPRLFVYHSEVNQNSITYELFLLMEKRLIKIILIISFYKVHNNKNDLQNSTKP